jgi:hypothetical protein
MVPTAAKMLWQFGRVAELADAKDLGSFGAILAGSIPVAPTLLQLQPGPEWGPCEAARSKRLTVERLSNQFNLQS